MAFGHVQIDQQAGHRFGAHGRTSVGVQGQHAGLDIVPRDGVGDELLGEFEHSRGAMSQPTTKRLKMSRITYRWKQVHLAGPLSLVMSHDQTWLGATASNSGLV